MAIGTLGTGLLSAVCLAEADPGSFGWDMISGSSHRDLDLAHRGEA